MKIIIETIPHKDQRYETCGDWYTDTNGSLRIKISEEMGERSAFAVAIHELIEWFLCKERGITEAMVDQFDFKYEEERSEGLRREHDDPGDDPHCPCHDEHQFATAIERRLMAHMLEKWSEHEKRVEALYQPPRPVVTKKHQFAPTGDFGPTVAQGRPA